MLLTVLSGAMESGDVALGDVASGDIHWEDMDFEDIQIHVPSPPTSMATNTWGSFDLEDIRIDVPSPIDDIRVMSPPAADPWGLQSRGHST